MLPKRKIGFGYIVGKQIICSVWNQCNYFSKEVMKVLSDLEARSPQYGKPEDHWSCKRSPDILT